MITRGRFDDALRMQIIEEYLAGASQYSLVKKYKLSSNSLIRDWLRTFWIEERSTGVPFVSSKAMNESEEIKRLKQELRQTKKALAESELKARAYDRMIDIAEERFKIPIRKKAGTKRSGR